MALVGGHIGPSGQDKTPLASPRIRKYPRRSRTLLNYVATRNWIPYSNHCNIANLARNHLPFLHRMNLMKRLPVHEGCVNTISWNKTGEYLLSGSDDCNLCITKPTYMFDNSKDYSVLHKVQTHHLGNIFDAKFIPNSGDTYIVSCSSEGPVIVHDINSHDPSEGIFTYNCHSSTIYEVATMPDDDKVFLSCGEDRTIRLFDMRVHRSCARAGTCPHPTLIRNSYPMTTLNLHPLNSNLLLVGRSDGVGLVYDRRKLPDPAKFSREKAHADRISGTQTCESISKFMYMHPLDGVIAQFTVPDMDEKYRFTSLCFNADGSQVLASYSGDYVYLFNHDRSSNFELIQTLPKKPRSSSRSDDNNDNSDKNRARSQTSDRNRSRGTRISRIRVRGDWSDTGVNSTPRSTRRETQNTSQSTTNFLQHMADVAFSLSTRRAGSRPMYVPLTELIAGPIEYGSSSNDSNESSNDHHHQQQRGDRETIDEEDEEDDNSTVIDEDEDDVDDDDNDNDDDDDDESQTNDSANIDGSFGRYVDITVEGLMNEATQRIASRKTSDPIALDSKDESGKFSRDDGNNNNRLNCTKPNNSQQESEDDKPKISQQTKLKFKRTLDNLKSRFNQIPTYHPHVKYQGHRNSRTSIKEAIFWGDNYVMSGSDCGRIMIWEKDTAKIVMGFPADERVVNCLAPNPHHYVLASSGIDYDIKLWSTQSLLEGPLRVSDDEMKRIIDNNELMLEESKQTISVPPHLFFRVLASLADNNRR